MSLENKNSWFYPEIAKEWEDARDIPVGEHFYLFPDVELNVAKVHIFSTNIYIITEDTPVPISLQAKPFTEIRGRVYYPDEPSEGYTVTMDDFNAAARVRKFLANKERYLEYKTGWDFRVDTNYWRMVQTGLMEEGGGFSMRQKALLTRLQFTTTYRYTPFTSDASPWTLFEGDSADFSYFHSKGDGPLALADWKEEPLLSILTADELAALKEIDEDIFITHFLNNGNNLMLGNPSIIAKMKGKFELKSKPFGAYYRQAYPELNFDGNE